MSSNDDESKEVDDRSLSPLRHSLPSSLPPPSSPPSSREELEAIAIEAHRQLEAANRHIDLLEAREAQRKRDMRRQSMGIPSTLLPTVSHLTDPAIRSPQRTAVRAHFQQGDISDLPRTPHTPQRSTVVSAGLSDEEKQYNTRRQKVLGKLPLPSKFSNEKVGDSEKIDHWVRAMTRYVDGQFFDMFGPQVEADKMAFILASLEGPAATWMSQTYQEADEERDTWDKLAPMFVQWVKGGVNLREEWELQMKKLAFGKGKCTDLIRFEAEFEQLRIRLYPTSSTNIHMNQRSAGDYLDAIERGNRALRAEMISYLHIANLSGEAPTLSQVRGAAQQAVAKMRLLSTFNSDRFSRSSSSSSSSSAPSQFGRNRLGFGSGRVNSLESSTGDLPAESELTWERQEGEEEQGALSNVQIQNAQRSDNRPANSDAKRTKRRGVPLDTATRTKLTAAGHRCFDCYGLNHPFWECKVPTNKLPKRKPNAEELKELKD